MKLIIAGSRGLARHLVMAAIEAELGDGVGISEVVSGRAEGVDTYGEQWAAAHRISVKGMPADWKKYGLPAGYIRNYAMGSYGDKLLAVWDGTSRGTAHMIKVMKAQGKPVKVVTIT